MLATIDSLEVRETSQERFVRELRATTTLEEFLVVASYENTRGLNLSFAENDAQLDHMHMLMRRHISEIKTPEDVVAVHNYFKSLGIYSRAIQEVLGMKAKLVIEGWHPDTRAFHGYGLSHRN